MDRVALGPMNLGLSVFDNSWLVNEGIDKHQDGACFSPRNSAKQDLVEVTPLILIYIKLHPSSCLK